MRWLIRKIKSWFKRDYVSRHSNDRFEASNGEERARKTGLLIGHSMKDKGANNKAWYIKSTSYSGIYDEYYHDYDMDGDRLLEEYELSTSAAITSQLTYANRDKGRGRRGAAEQLAEADCTEIISLHCNSYNGIASGVEVWFLDGVPESKQFANEVLTAYVKEFPHLKNRGLKKATRKSRAYGVLDACRDNGVLRTCLLEKYFIDVESDFIEPRLIGNFLRKFGVK